MKRPKHLVRGLEDLPSELRTRLRLGDPSLIIVHWPPKSGADKTLLEFVECLDAYETIFDWIQTPVKIRRFDEGLTSWVGGGMALANTPWLKSEDAIWVEDDS